jgi:hypothetical protein
MLAKSLCGNCGHSFLTDAMAQGVVECPRCHFKSDAPGPASRLSAADLGPDPLMEALPGEQFHARAASFDPAAPPPMFVTRERWTRGVVFGSVCAAILGVLVGAAFAALGVVLPLADALAVGVAAGFGCRYGFGGRSVRQTRPRAAVAAIVAVAVGFGAFVAGSWTVARLTGTRAEVTREDLDAGLEALARKRARSNDAGERILLDEQILEVEKLRRRTDAQLEDYLWMQEGRIAHPLLAYGKLRATEGPVLRLGVEAEPVRLPGPATAAIYGADLLLAIGLAIRGVYSRRDR